MQAVILAAGKGTRIFPFSTNKPKPLVEVANKPVLEHNLEQLLGLVDEIIIIVGYKKDMIIDRFGDNYKGIKLTYVVQEKQLGTGHAVLMAKDHIHSKFLVINGDDLFSRIDLESISKYDYCILVKHKDNPSAFGVVKIKDGKVIDIIEKPKEFISNLVNVGVYCFTPEIFSVIENLEPSIRGEYEITDAVKVIAKKGNMFYEEVKGYWIPVGYPWHILEATEILLDEKEEISIKGKLGENVIIEGTVDVGEGSIIGDNTIFRGNVVIGKGCVLGENCIIEGFSAISDGTRIGNNVKLVNTIIGAGCHLEDDCEVRDSIIGDKVCLSKGVKVSNLGKKKTVTVNGNGKELDSGRKNLGAFVGDRCEVCKELHAGECIDKDC